MTHRQDDRTTEQKKTHKWLVTATDKFMSGWGKASQGKSKVAWACEGKDLDKVERWVNNRSDMSYVNVTQGNWYPKAAHVHIYVVDENHPARQ
jgi:hypothetical protein